MQDKCICPEMPYCPTCPHGFEYREPWWEDGQTEWVCYLQADKKQEQRIQERRKSL